jgi:hypothetical protein
MPKAMNLLSGYLWGFELTIICISEIKGLIQRRAFFNKPIVFRRKTKKTSN